MCDLEMRAECLRLCVVGHNTHLLVVMSSCEYIFVCIRSIVQLDVPVTAHKVSW